MCWPLASPANLNILTFPCWPMSALSLIHCSQLQTLQFFLQEERKQLPISSGACLGKMSALKPESCFFLWVVIAGCSALPYKWVWGGGCFGWNWRGTGGTTSCKLEEALPDYDHCLHADDCWESSWKAQKPSPYLEKGPWRIIIAPFSRRLPPVGFRLLCKHFAFQNAVMWITLSHCWEMII